MRFHAFVFTWGGHAAAARVLERELAPLAKVNVISSQDVLVEPSPGWVAIGADAYFSAQWNAALERFDGDVMFHIQADARPADMAALFARARRLFARTETGILEPHIDYTDIRYDRKRLREIEPGLHEVPLTDCTCWFIHGDLVAAFPKFDLSVNRLGWGTCGVMAGLCRLSGKLCLRDDTLAVAHPRSRGYSSPAALRERTAYLQSLAPELRRAVEFQYAQKAHAEGRQHSRRTRHRAPFWARWMTGGDAAG